MFRAVKLTLYFNGESLSIFLFLEQSGYVVCESFQKVKNVSTNETKITRPLEVRACPAGTKCMNATYETKTTSSPFVHLKGYISTCINATLCANLTAYGKSQLEKGNVIMTAGDGACCDGDLCNARNKEGVYVHLLC